MSRSAPVCRVSLPRLPDQGESCPTPGKCAATHRPPAVAPGRSGRWPWRHSTGSTDEAALSTDLAETSRLAGELRADRLRELATVATAPSRVPLWGGVAQYGMSHDQAWLARDAHLALGPDGRYQIGESGRHALAEVCGEACGPLDHSRPDDHRCRYALSGVHARGVTTVAPSCRCAFTDSRTAQRVMLGSPRIGWVCAAEAWRAGWCRLNGHAVVDAGHWILVRSQGILLGASARLCGEAVDHRLAHCRRGQVSGHVVRA